MSLIVRLALLYWTLAILPLTAAERLAVVTGTTIVHDLALRIGGDRIDARCLLEPGVDPHLYQPVPEDARRLAKAQVVIINGLGFEGWFEDLAREAAFRGTVVVATAGIIPLMLREPGHQDGVPDPHAFNAILLGVRYAENIRDGLSAADPAGAEAYRQRAVAVIQDLEAADAWARTTFQAIPRAQRRIVTNHDALQYFARDYGFEILPVTNALEDSEPSAADLAALVTTIKAQGVRGVFLEYGHHPRVVEQIAREAGVRVGRPLYLDGVGAPDSPAATYVGMFRENVLAICDALR